MQLGKDAKKDGVFGQVLAIFGGHLGSTFETVVDRSCPSLRGGLRIDEAGGIALFILSYALRAMWYCMTSPHNLHTQLSFETLRSVAAYRAKTEKMRDKVCVRLPVLVGDSYRILRTLIAYCELLSRTANK